ncbi:MAG: hypothetical protein M0Z27_12040, partial [Thermaerobacter sp.]|nr:hypothetical protein [Thermaerobacter sp.]
VPTDYPGAGALALLLTAAVGGALLVQLALLRRYRYATVHGGCRPPPPTPWAAPAPWPPPPWAFSSPRRWEHPWQPAC